MSERTRVGLMQIRGGADWVDPASVTAIVTTEGFRNVVSLVSIPPYVLVRARDGVEIRRMCVSMTEAEALAEAIAADLKAALTPTPAKED